MPLLTIRTPITGRLALTVLGFVSLAALSKPARAQACFGMPSDGAVTYHHARYSLERGHGGGVSVTPGPLAIAVNGNTRSRENEVVSTTGFEGAGRVAIVLPVGRVQVCPGISLGYTKLTETHTAEFDVSNQQAALRGGGGIGLEQHVFKGIHIIPSLGVHYDFTAKKYDVIAEDGQNETTGDTLSRLSIEYSLGIRYRFAYAAAIAERYGDSKGSRPTKARWVVGFAFGGGRRE